MAYFAHNRNSGSSATPSVDYPASIAADDILTLICSVDSTTADFESGDWGAFTELDDVNCTAEGQSTAYAWKRASGSETGTLTLGNLGVSTGWVLTIVVHRGRHTTNPPTIATTVINNSANNDPVTVTSNSLDFLDGDDALWFSAPDVTSGPDILVSTTQPASYTMRDDFGKFGTGGSSWAKLCVATRDNVSAGTGVTASGELDISSPAAGFVCGFIRYPVAAGGGGGAKTAYYYAMMGR
jgi:hypothetical protein